MTTQRDLVPTLVSRVFEGGKYVGQALMVRVSPAHIEHIAQHSAHLTRLYIREKFVQCYRMVGLPGQGIGEDEDGCYILANMTLQSAKGVYYAT